MKIDLKDAYLTVPIWKNHQKYLRFLWKGSMLAFGCLPFGMATAPRVFTQLMMPVVWALWQRGICLIIYLDDLLIMAESHDQALHHAATTLSLLEGLGFVVNYQKSQLLPSQEIEFLGFLIDSNTKDSEKVSGVVSSDHGFSARIVQIPGPPDLLHSGNISRPSPSPSLQTSSETKEYNFSFSKSYNAMVALDQAAYQEILWWRDHLHAWNGRALFQDPVDLAIETDASRKGWGHTVRE